MSKEEKEILVRCPICGSGNIISDPLFDDDCMCLDCNCAFTAKSLNVVESPVYGYHTGDTDGDNINEVHYEEVENPEYKNVKEPSKEDLVHRVEELEHQVKDLSKQVDDLQWDVWIVKKLIKLWLEKTEE